jgi:uncharacterized protein YggU (UPF0235/DUF167 family)
VNHDPVTESAAGPILRIRVTPRARRPGVVAARAGALLVSVSAAPEKGRATREAIERVASWLGIKASAVRLHSGATARDKRLLVEGLSASDLRKRVDSALRDGGVEAG